MPERRPRRKEASCGGPTRHQEEEEGREGGFPGIVGQGKADVRGRGGEACRRRPRQEGPIG